jgi:hypothetical protein
VYYPRLADLGFGILTFLRVQITSGVKEWPMPSIINLRKLLRPKEPASQRTGPPTSLKDNRKYAAATGLSHHVRDQSFTPLKSLDLTLSLPQA